MSKKIYNEEYKMKFIETVPIESLKATAKTVFRASYATEIKLDKDLALFSKKELIELFEEHNWTNKNFFNTVRRTLLRYGMYTLQNGIINNDQYQIFSLLSYSDINSSTSYLNKYYKSFNEVVNTLNKIFDSETDFILLRMKCICGLLWYGMPEEDIIKFTVNHIDQAHNTIKCDSINKRISVPKNIVDWCNVLGNTLTYVNAIGKMYALSTGPEIIKTKQLNDNKSEDAAILKNITRNFVMSVDEKLSTMTEEQRNEINYKRICIENMERNGRFARAYEKECADQLIKNSSDYAKVLNVQKRHRSINIREYEAYCNWKEAYGLK